MKKKLFGLILSFLLTAPSFAIQNPFLELSQGISAIHQLKGSLKMEATVGKECRKSGGDLFFSEPSLIRLHLIEPEEYELYQDDRFLRVYQPSSRIVEVYQKEKVSLEATLLLGRLQKLPWESLRSLANYSFSEKGKNKAGQRILYGTPLAEGQPKCLVWMDEKLPQRVDFFEPLGDRRLNSTRFWNYRKLEKTWLPMSVEVREKSLRFAIHFSRVTLNPCLPDSSFTFKALPGLLIENK